MFLPPNMMNERPEEPKNPIVKMILKYTGITSDILKV